MHLGLVASDVWLKITGELLHGVPRRGSEPAAVYLGNSGEVGVLEPIFEVLKKEFKYHPLSAGHNFSRFRRGLKI